MRIIAHLDMDAFFCGCGGAYSPHVEQSSIDEAYFDLSKVNGFKKAREMVEAIKQEIKKKEQLMCSVGIGINKLIAFCRSFAACYAIFRFSR